MSRRKPMKRPELRRVCPQHGDVGRVSWAAVWQGGVRHAVYCTKFNCGRECRVVTE